MFGNGTIVAFESLSPSEQIGALAAISQTLAAFLSLSALLVSLWVFARQQKLNRWQLRLHREDHIIAWSRACLSQLATVEERLKTFDAGVSPTATSAAEHPLPPDQLIAARSCLSALIDEGRLYFPNIRDPRKGRDKHTAYRGSRQTILDPLVAIYDHMAVLQQEQADGPLKPDTMSAHRETLNTLRRAFVSASQAAIDPRRFNRVRA